jgi:hypothetical protein
MCSSPMTTLFKIGKKYPPKFALYWAGKGFVYRGLWISYLLGKLHGQVRIIPFNKFFQKAE